MLVKGATGINNADSSGACLGDGLQNKMVHRYSRQNTHTPWHGCQEATFDNFSDPSLMTNKPAPLKHEVAPLTRKYMIQVSNPKSGGGHDKTVAQELFLMFLWGKCDCNLPLAKQLCHEVIWLMGSRYSSVTLNSRQKRFWVPEAGMKSMDK